MTCVVGVTNGKKVILGADSAFWNGDENASSFITDDPPKVWRINKWVVGFSGDMNTICVARELLETATWNSPRELFSLLKKVAKEGDFCALLGNSGVLWTTDSDGAWAKIQDRHEGRKLVKAAYSVGSGSKVALGALYATQHLPDTERITIALKASSYYMDGIKPPFRIVSE